MHFDPSLISFVSDNNLFCSTRDHYGLWSYTLHTKVGNTLKCFKCASDIVLINIFNSKFNLRQIWVQIHTLIFRNKADWLGVGLIGGKIIKKITFHILLML